MIAILPGAVGAAGSLTVGVAASTRCSPTSVSLLVDVPFANLVGSSVPDARFATPPVRQFDELGMFGRVTSIVPITTKLTTPTQVDQSGLLQDVQAPDLSFTARTKDPAAAEGVVDAVTPTTERVESATPELQKRAPCRSSSATASLLTPPVEIPGGSDVDADAIADDPSRSNVLARETRSFTRARPERTPATLIVSGDDDALHIVARAGIDDPTARATIVHMTEQLADEFGMKLAGYHLDGTAVDFSSNPKGRSHGRIRS